MTRGLIVRLIASAAVGGLVARADAVAMPKLSGGHPVSLSAAGEWTFFALGAAASAIGATIVGVWLNRSNSIEKCGGLVGLAWGIGIGLLCGLATVPSLCLVFFTVPREVFEVLTLPPVNPPIQPGGL